MTKLLKINQCLVDNWEQEIEKLETGDILLMDDTSFWFSKMVTKISGSKWSHIGIILKDPTYINPALQGLYLWQSGTETYVDSEDKINKFGVRIDDLKEKLETYTGYIAYRKLNPNLKELVPDFEERLVKAHKIAHGDKYDINIIDFLNAREYVQESQSIWSKLFKKTNNFFCSALVGFIYQQLGLLPEDTEWTCCEPKTFSSEDDKLELKHGFTLSDEVFLKQ